MEFVDTHAHLDAREFLSQGLEEVSKAQLNGVSKVVIPAVAPANFQAVVAMAKHPGVYFTLGIHPMYVEHLDEPTALASVIDAVNEHRTHPRFVGIGEIGLDYFVPGLDRGKQLRFFQAQLRLAREFELPVVTHVRRSSDHIARECRRFGVKRGIAHAFNGSHQQAHALFDLGLRLGFGGAMTFTRALQLRRLAKDLPIEALVLETDAPDIAPSWLGKGDVNSPIHLPRIADTLAQLRDCSVEEIAGQTTANALASLPRLIS